MEMFDLDIALRPTAEKVLFETKPISYSYGDEEALLRWLSAMNAKEIENVLKISGARKYPLIWLLEGWEGEKKAPGYQFQNVQFYISMNSKIETLNENREPIFDKLFGIANDFITKLKLSGIRIQQNSIQWTKRANFGKAKVSSEKVNTITDVWDTIILTLNLEANTDCFKHLKN